MDWDPVTHYKDVEIAERYDRVRFSSWAGRVFNALEKRYVAKAIQGLTPGSSILDLPCGTGRLAEVMLNAGHKVEGADVSPAMLEVARRKLQRFGERFSTRVLDVMTLPADAPAQYDAALCARVLMHFPLDDQIRFLRGVAQLSRGPVILTQSFSTPYHRARRRFKRMIGNQPSANHPITESELRQLLDGAGLREVRRLRPARLVTEAIVVVAQRR